MKARIASIILTVLTAAVVGYCCYVCYYEVGQGWYIVFDIIFCALFYPVAVFLHECGHVLFGFIVNIKAIPSIDLKYSSSCEIVPKTDKNLRPGIMFTAVGGLVINALFMALGLCALFVPAVPVHFCIVLPASFYLFAFNALPLMTDCGKTDGLVLLEFATNADEAKVALAVMTVQAKILKGQAIGEIDEELLFNLPQIAEDDLSFIALTELRYEYFRAKGDWDKAEKYKTRFEQLKEEYV